MIKVSAQGREPRTASQACAAQRRATTLPFWAATLGCWQKRWRSAMAASRWSSIQANTFRNCSDGSWALKSLLQSGGCYRAVVLVEHQPGDSTTFAPFERNGGVHGFYEEGGF